MEKFTDFEIQSAIQRLESEAQFVKSLYPGTAAALTLASKIIRQLHDDPFHSIKDLPPYRVGDKKYTGYLVVSDGYFAVADYTKDEFDLTPSFHVDGEYDPSVTHWMMLPKMPEDAK